MAFVPLKIVGKCVADDETLFQNMESAVARGYPQVTKQESPKDGMITLVASGPSVAGQLDVIREMAKTSLVVAIKDAHDWLIDNGVVPDYALAIDPQEHRISFHKPNTGVEYMIASQCHKAMFDNLEGHKVTIWHPYVMKGQNRPKNSLLIGGGTTSGLRAISLFYVLGWRHFALFGFDSCLDGDKLRVNGSGLKEGDKITEIRIDQEGETFYCNASMALQAEHFQTYYDYLPDAQYYGFGHGLIQAIIKKREENAVELQALIDKQKEPNDRVSFIHWGDKNSASWRYRAKIVSEGWASLNDFTADTLIFAKPQANELMEMARAKARGAWVIVDFCDDHFDWVHYKEALRIADAVTCPTETMAKIIKEHGRDATVIGDPYEYPEAKPHFDARPFKGFNLLWYGHAVNKYSLDRIMGKLEYKGYKVRVVSNFLGSIPWSHETMLKEFARADIVLMPATAEYKSPNRAIEAIRQGCFVVSERDLGIPHIYVGNILEGIQWTQTQDINTLISKAQKFVTEEFTPRILIDKWKTLTKLRTTSDVEKRSGTDG